MPVSISPQATAQDKASYVGGLLAERISRLHSSEGWFRTRYYITRMSTVVLSGVVTVLAGLKAGGVWGDRVNTLILVLGAASTIISAWGAFFSPRESWHLYALTLGKLYALKAKLEFESLEGNPDEAHKEFTGQVFAEFQQIMDSHNQQWLALRKK